MGFFVVVVLVCVGGVFAASPVAERNLHDDYLEFKLVVAERENEIATLIGEYITDEKFVEDLGGFTGPELKSLVEEIDKIQEFQQIIEFLYQQKFDTIYQSLAEIHKALQVPIPEYIQQHLPPFQKLLPKAITEPGLRGFLNQLKPLINQDAIIKLYRDKEANSKPFQDFLAKLRSEDVKTNLITKIKTDPNYLALEQHAVDIGLNVETFQRLLDYLFGWGI